ncbi:MAG: hypothetical protein JSU68_11645 [Phycisphaerales bacterium]|nr:MAG: hypothetical protein JSU68_11645 [Phycisphaerales bacterium]
MVSIILAFVAAAFKPVSVISAAGAAALLCWGACGGKTSQGPCCRRCHADLSQRDGNHCPKCGLLLTPDDIRSGTRHCRRRALMAGSVLLFLSVISFVALQYG